MFNSLKRKCAIMLVFSYYHIINIFGGVDVKLNTSLLLNYMQMNAQLQDFAVYPGELAHSTH
jgi:hypothetical protein